MKRFVLWIIFFGFFSVYLQAEERECTNLNSYVQDTKSKYSSKIKSAVSAIDEITYMNLFLKKVNKHINNCYQKTNNYKLQEALKNAYNTYEKAHSLGKRGLLLRGSTGTGFANNMEDGNILSGLFSAALNTDEVERLNKEYKQTFLEGNKYLKRALGLIY